MRKNKGTKRNQKSEQRNKNYCVIAELSNSDVKGMKIMNRSGWIYLRKRGWDTRKVDAN